MRDRLIVGLAFHRAWALEATTFERLCSIVQAHIEREPVSEAARAFMAQQRVEREGSFAYEPEPTQHGPVRVIPVLGVIAPRAAMVNDISQPQGTSVDGLREALASALEDPETRSIVMTFDTPGGSVDGLVELAQEIRAARERKPVYAIANYQALSAGWWLAAQATRVFVTPGGRLGSMGIVHIAVDGAARIRAREGAEVKVISSASKKVISATDTRMTTEALAAIVRDLDVYHALFVADVAAGRGVEQAVAASWADGDVHVGEAAVQIGLADAVASFESVLAEAGAEAMKAPRTPATTAGTTPARTPSASRAEAAPPPVDPLAEDAPPGDEDDDEDEEGQPGEDAGTRITVETPGASAQPPRRRSTKAAHADGVRHERQRQAQIRALAEADQHELVASLIEDGSSVDEARVALHDDLRQRRVKAPAGRAARADLAPVETAPMRSAPAAQPQLDADQRHDRVLVAQCEAIWRNDPATRHEFGNNFALFVEYQAGVQCGVVRSRSGLARSN